MNDLAFDVIGAQGPREYFEHLTSETLAHAYVFSGPRGVGKKTFARRLAQSLLCRADKPGVIGYDDTCASCALFRAGAMHPDFLEHEGALRIGERDAGVRLGDDLTARELIRRLSLESYSGGMRVLLLGDLEFSTHHAGNALLKFFEEPPRGVVLIMTTISPESLLPTIRSRTIEVRFPLLSQRDVAEILTRKGLDARECENGARLAHGSVTRALAAIESQEASVRTQVARWFFDVVAGGTPEEGWASRETLDAGLEVLKGLVRDWIVLRSAQGPPLFSDYAEELRKLPVLPATHMSAILDRVDEAQRLAQTNVSPTMVSEIVRMALALSLL